MYEFIKSILEDGNMVKVYLASGESVVLTEVDGEADGIILGSHNHGDQKVRYALTTAQIEGAREHW